MSAMSVSGSDLTTPVLLMAMPQVLDPFFHRSVVLLLHHEDEGSFGFIVNRPTATQVSEILKGMEVGWAGREEAVAYFGGPVQPAARHGALLARPRRGRTRGHGDRGGPRRRPDAAHRRPLPAGRGAARPVPPDPRLRRLGRGAADGGDPPQRLADGAGEQRADLRPRSRSRSGTPPCARSASIRPSSPPGSPAATSEDSAN